MSLRERLAALVAASDPDGTITVRWIAVLLESEPAEQVTHARVAPSVAVDLDVPAVAELFKRGASTVRTWLAAGEFPNAYRLQGREWRIPHADVDALQRRQRDQHIAATRKPAPSVGQVVEWPNYRKPAA